MKNFTKSLSRACEKKHIGLTIGKFRHRQGKLVFFCFKNLAKIRKKEKREKKKKEKRKTGLKQAF
jgi:hypothetical protein